MIAVPLGAGIGVFQSPNNSSIMGSVPQGRLGVASGLVNITRMTGWIAGIAVLGTIWAVRTSAYAGGGDAAEAPAAAQASGLQDILLLNLVLILGMIGFSWWTWRGRLLRKRAVEAPA